jgi:hypothetical protein
MEVPFDYCTTWKDVWDVLGAVKALNSAILSLPRRPDPFAAIRYPLARNIRQSQEPAYPGAVARATEAMRKAAIALDRLLSEDRFTAPLAQVWPPSAPKDLANRLSLALNCGLQVARRVMGLVRHVGGAELSAADVVSMLERALADMEQRRDVAGFAYQWKLKKLNLLRREEVKSSLSDASVDTDDRQTQPNITPSEDRPELPTVQTTSPETPDANTKTRLKPSEPTPDTKRIIRDLQKGMSIDDVAAKHEISADNARKIRSRYAKRDTT